MGVSLVEYLITYAKAHGASLRPGVPAERLEAFEVHHGVLLPDDLRVFYSLCNGFGWAVNDPDFIRSLVEVWPLERPEQVSPPGSSPWSTPDDLGEAGAYFTFADYLIKSEVFSIRLTDDLRAGNPVVQGPYTPHTRTMRIAASFSEFARLYLEQPRALLGIHRIDRLC